MRLAAVTLLALVSILELASARTPRGSLVGAWTIEGRESDRGRYAGRVDASLRADGTYALSGEVRYDGDARTWRLTGQARDGRSMVVVRTRLSAGPGTPGLAGALLGRPGAPAETRRGEGTLRASEDALTLSGTLIPGGAPLTPGVTGRTAEERWVRADRADTVVLKVVQLNLKGVWPDWLTRRGRIADMLRREQPDIVLMQEVLGVGNGSPVHAGALARLTGMNSAFRSFHPVLGGAARFGNAVLARGPIVHVDARRLTRGAPKNEVRTALFTRLEVRPGVRVNVINTHLHHLAADEDLRLTQGREVLRWVDELQDRPVLVGGDFNSRPDQPLYSLLTRDAGLRDAWTAAHPRDPGGTFPVRGGKIRIDYLLWKPLPAPACVGLPAEVAAGGGVRVLSARIIGEPDLAHPDALSDHSGVIFTLELAR